MRVEGHDDYRQAEFAANLDRAVEIALVTAVHAVENSDRDDGLAPVCGHILEAVPAVHGCFPLLRLSATRLAMPHHGFGCRRRATMRTKHHIGNFGADERPPF